MQLYKENIMSYHASKYEQGVLWIEHILASNTNFKLYTAGLYSSSKFICNMQPARVKKVIVAYVVVLWGLTLPTDLAFQKHMFPVYGLVG